MKILIDVRVLGRGPTAGIPVYTRSLVDELLNLNTGHFFELFYPGARKVKLPVRWRSHSQVRIWDMRIPNKLFELSSRLLHVPVLDARRPMDIIFSPHFNILTAKHTPRILTIHDLSFLHHPYFFSPRQKFWHWLQNVNEQIASAQHLIAISEFTKQDLMQRLAVPEEKISVIHSGISPEFKKVPAENLELQYLKKHFELHRPFFLYLGTIEARKNLITLIDGFARFREETAEGKEFELVIAGRPGWGSQEVFDRAVKSSAREHIVFFHDIADDERVFLYNLAGGFVYPSFFEGFGFPPLEAQACGVPVIAADRASVPEILGTNARGGQGSALLVNPWDSYALSDAMRVIASDAAMRNSLIKRGFENIKRFSWKTTAEQTLKLLEKHAQTTS